MKRRKNRVVVEITTNKPITPRQARQAASILLGQIDTQATPIWASTPYVYVDKLDAKEFDRVVNAVARQQVDPDAQAAHERVKQREFDNAETVHELKEWIREYML